jgi:hypothetical protein
MACALSAGLACFAAHPVCALSIAVTIDPSIAASPQANAIESAVASAVQTVEALLTDPITVSIAFRYSTKAPDGVTPLGAGTLAQSNFTVYAAAYDTYASALAADAKTPTDAVAVTYLPSTPPAVDMLFSSASGRAVGLDTPGAMNAAGSVGVGGTLDGIVTLNSSVAFAFARDALGANQFDARRSIAHEIDEILGLGSILPATTDFRHLSAIMPEDLYRYSAPGMHSLTSNGAATAYCSIDGGTTAIVGFNQIATGDFGDWYSPPCPHAEPLVQSAFGCPGQLADVSASSPEAIALDAIGYDLLAESPSPTATEQPTETATITRTAIDTPTASATAAMTSTASVSPTATELPTTVTPADSATPTMTTGITPTESTTPTAVASPPASATASPPNTATPSATCTATAAATETAAPMSTTIAYPTDTVTASPTSTATASPTDTAAQRFTASASATPSPTSAFSPTALAPSETPEPSQTVQPTDSATAPNTATATPPTTPTFTATASATPSPEPIEPRSPTAAGTDTPLPPDTATPTAGSDSPTLTASAPIRTPSPPCIGDCTGHGVVTVDGLIALVNIALGTASVAACPAGIPPGTPVDVALIVRAVRNALSGCSG